MNRILFVCTGNYYRSRMAEEIFNYWADHYDLKWKADSAGLRSDMSQSSNVGPISGHAVEMLNQGDYPVESVNRMPRSLVAEDFENNQRVICLNRPEHRPMLLERFTDYEAEVTYWEVPDIEELEPTRAFQQIVFETGRLIFKLNS